MTKKRAKIYWTRQAQEDMREIRSFIARDAPKTAAAYVRGLRASVDSLRQFPELGEIVPELGKPEIRELIRGQYRVIYRYRPNRVDILTIFHSARLLTEGDL